VTRAISILWPAFLTAGVLDALVFAVIDPHEMRWFGGALIGWPPVTIYSVTFLIFWAGIAAAAAMTALLLLSAAEVNGFGAGDDAAAAAQRGRA
jgi:hypothetical protein